MSFALPVTQITALQNTVIGGVLAGRFQNESYGVAANIFQEQLNRTYRTMDSLEKQAPRLQQDPHHSMLWMPRLLDQRPAITPKKKGVPHGNNCSEEARFYPGKDLEFGIKLFLRYEISSAVDYSFDATVWLFGHIHTDDFCRDMGLRVKRGMVRAKDQYREDCRIGIHERYDPSNGLPSVNDRNTELCFAGNPTKSSSSVKMSFYDFRLIENGFDEAGDPNRLEQQYSKRTTWDLQSSWQRARHDLWMMHRLLWPSFRESLMKQAEAKVTA